MQVLRLDAAACLEPAQGFSENTFLFTTPPLEATGSYTFTSEWQESRPELANGQEANVIRSPASSVSVSPGPAADVEVLFNAL